jgi:hypothetical protein
MAGVGAACVCVKAKIEDNHLTNPSMTGPLIYLDGAGQPIVVINTLEVAVDLLDRKAGVTSDRPHIIVPDMMTGGLFTPFVGHNDM